MKQHPYFRLVLYRQLRQPLQQVVVRFALMEDLQLPQPGFAGVHHKTLPQQIAKQRMELLLVLLPVI